MVDFKNRVVRSAFFQRLSRWVYDLGCKMLVASSSGTGVYATLSDCVTDLGINQERVMKSRIAEKMLREGYVQDNLQEAFESYLETHPDATQKDFFNEPRFVIDRYLKLNEAVEEAYANG